MTPMPATVSVPLKLTRWADAPIPAVCKQEGETLWEMGVFHPFLKLDKKNSVYFTSVWRREACWLIQFTMSTVIYFIPLVRRRPCSRSHVVYTLIAPSSQMFPGGIWRGSSSALLSWSPQWWGTRSAPGWSDGGRTVFISGWYSLVKKLHTLQFTHCIYDWKMNCFLIFFREEKEWLMPIKSRFYMKIQFN